MSELIVFCNCSSEEEAKKIAKKLIDNVYVACVNILPKITSIYRWKGKIHNEQEFMMIIKTNEKNYKNVEALIKKEHSYEVPEIIAIDIKHGLKEYLSWLNSECK